MKIDLMVEEEEEQQPGGLFPATPTELFASLPEAQDSGEQTLYWQHDPSKPYKLFCVKPDLGYLTLPEEGGNWSKYPAGGYAEGSDMSTTFKKLRFDPARGLVKTDDFTYATTTGKITQSYWRGKGLLTLENVPYATARSSDEVSKGSAAMDLRGTPFCVATQFCAMGCSPQGSCKVSADHKVVALQGGGTPGRVCPEGDTTDGEEAIWPDFNDEGKNGGWFLKLEWCGNTEKDEPLHLEEECVIVEERRGSREHAKRPHFGADDIDDDDDDDELGEEAEGAQYEDEGEEEEENDDDDDVDAEGPHPGEKPRHNAFEDESSTREAIKYFMENKNEPDASKGIPPDTSRIRGEFLAHAMALDKLLEKRTAAEAVLESARQQLAAIDQEVARERRARDISQTKLLVMLSAGMGGMGPVHIQPMGAFNVMGATMGAMAGQMGESGCQQQ